MCGHYLFDQLLMTDEQSAQGILGHVAVINYFRVTYHSGYILKGNGICTVRDFAVISDSSGVSKGIDILEADNLIKIKKLFGTGFYDTVNIFACCAHNKPFLWEGFAGPFPKTNQPS
jgi:hypothetical protein